MFICFSFKYPDSAIIVSTGSLVTKVYLRYFAIFLFLYFCGFSTSRFTVQIILSSHLCPFNMTCNDANGARSAWPFSWTSAFPISAVCKSLFDQNLSENFPNSHNFQSSWKNYYWSLILIFLNSWVFEPSWINPCCDQCFLTLLKLALWYDFLVLLGYFWATSVPPFSKMLLFQDISKALGSCFLEQNSNWKFVKAKFA